MSEPPALRFGAFELNSGTGELRRHGDVIKLAPQPFKVLELLARRSGEVVTRANIREHIWCNDTFVDFEQGLELLHPPDPGGPRRHRGRAQVHRDPSTARLPIPHARDGVWHRAARAPMAPYVRADRERQMGERNRGRSKRASLSIDA